MGMSHMQLNKLHGLPSDFFAAVQFAPLYSVACTRNRSSVSVFIVYMGIGEMRTGRQVTKYKVEAVVEGEPKPGAECELQGLVFAFLLWETKWRQFQYVHTKRKLLP